MSDTNNNIPTRITQLEEATEYEDGMFYAVAKAGRGTYKIPVDEMTPNEQALSDKIENEIAPAVENSFAYGTVDESEIATFTDGSDLPMPKLEVAIEPQQSGSGDPSPTNIRPISGWSAVDVNKIGKNNAKVTNKGKDGITPLNTYNSTLQISGNEFILTPKTSSDEAYFGSISYSSSSSESSFNAFYSVPIKENTQYTFNLSNNNFDKNIIQFFDDELNVLPQEGIYYKHFLTNTGTVTAPTGATWMTCRIGMSSGTAGTAYKTTLQIEEGSTATTYEPYNPNSETITIQLGDTYYGGKLDVVSGVLTVDRAYVDLGTLNWSMSPSVAHAFYARPSLNYALGEDVVILCSNYPFAGTRTIGYYVEKKLTCYRRLEETMPSEFYIQDNAYSDATTFKTAMNGVQLVYELATPIEVQLTPTQVNSLLGSNNIWANTGNILKVEYIRDLDIVINSLLERIAALEG